MSVGSIVGRNVKNIMCRYDIPTEMCHVTFPAVKRLITTYDNVSVDNKMYGGIIAEYINVCDSTKNCDSMNHNDAYDIILYLATTGVYNWMVDHALTVLCCWTSHHVLALRCTK